MKKDDKPFYLYGADIVCPYCGDKHINVPAVEDYTGNLRCSCGRMFCYVRHIEYKTSCFDDHNWEPHRMKGEIIKSAEYTLCICMICKSTKYIKLDNNNNY